jgi:spore coat protein A
VTLNPLNDTTIYQGTDPNSGEFFEDNSCGIGTNLFSGITNDGFVRRALLRFDIAAAIPAGSTINSVTLTLTINRSGDNQDAPMELHAIDTDWGEGTVDCDPVRGGGQGLDANPGDATWLDAMFQQVAWGTSGGDLRAFSATALVGTSGEAVWNSGGNPGMVTDLQNWLDAPTSNLGWIVLGDEARSSTTRRFSSREGRTPPVLTVDFTPTGDVFACCFDDGACTVADTASCSDQGGTPDSSTSSCQPNPCAQPVGACCNLDESCSESVERDVCEGTGGSFQGSGSTCSQGSVDCGLEPFVDPLPIPGVLQPVGTRGDGAPRYEVTMTQERQQLHRDLPATDVWTYNGTFPGPTLEARVGQPVEVTYVNDLPNQGNRGGHYLEVDECAHGPNYWQDTARAVVHLHGGHVPARFDGHPEYDILPGEFDVYEYPNNQLPATLWYHDHALGITRLNVYMGMAAYYLLRDDFEDGLGLPADEYEIPLVLQDREFNPDGSFFYPPTIRDAFFGSKLLVNGKVWPFLNVDQGKYRFRFLNGSQARTYELRLENLADPTELIPFQLIGTDGGLISAPISLDSFTMAPAERFDVVVDFESFPAGTEIVLRNDRPGVPTLPNAMKFVVQSQGGHTAPLPATLRDVTPILENEMSLERWFNLVRGAEPCAGGEWLIETLDGPDLGTAKVLGSHWDDITEYPILGATEIWEFINASNLMHPMHVHLVMFQVLDRVDMSTGQLITLDPWEVNTWKDTVRVPPNTRVRVIARYEDYLGKFPYHCHILDHEDHEMMRQFQTTNDPANCDLDGTCETGEDCQSCADCGEASGAFCGNGLCETGDGENFDNCSSDCAGKAKGKDPYKCGDPADGDPGEYVNCSGDPRCTDGFFCREAPRVPACCGDTVCEGQEDEASCAVDCAVGTGGDCSQIRDRDICNADPGCQWQGGPKNGSCEPVDCSPTEQPEVTCDDGIDNDCDGAIDGADADCGSCTVTEDPGVTCDDGIDNDCDLITDCDDPDCAADPVCQTVDCSVHTERRPCNDDPACTWDNKNKECVPV